MHPRALLLTVAFLTALAGCSQEQEATPEIDRSAPAETAAAAPESPNADLRERAKSALGTLPVEALSESNPITDDKVELGRVLYFDPRFSKNQDISCNTCHDLADFGVDGTPTSTGHKGQVGDRNAPTVYNAALHVAQFWDGRAADVEEQAKGPVLNPVEMAMPGEAAVIEVLKSVPGYEPLFAAAFPGEENPITYDNMARAIGAFERGLITNDRLDEFLEGDDSALSADERAGLAEFMDAGCITCHMGPTIGGTLYRKIGLVNPYETEDLGRFKVTQDEADRYVFKVPSLRNVAGTEPYFHDGSIASLPEAIRLMGHHQLGIELTDAQVASIAAFLGALNGTIDPDYIAPPALPESGSETPPPDPS